MLTWIFKKLPYSRGHIGYALPGYVGFIGYMIKETISQYRHDKREAEIDEEYSRRLSIITKEAIEWMKTILIQRFYGYNSLETHVQDQDNAEEEEGDDEVSVLIN